jgi:hypothetical protein
MCDAAMAIWSLAVTLDLGIGEEHHDKTIDDDYGYDGVTGLFKIRTQEPGRDLVQAVAWYCELMRLGWPDPSLYAAIANFLVDGDEEAGVPKHTELALELYRGALETWEGANEDRRKRHTLDIDDLKNDIWDLELKLEK